MNIPMLTFTVKAAAALAANRGVTASGAVPAAGAAICGFTRTAAAAAGDLLPVDAMGTTLAESGAAIAAGAAVEVDNQGRVVTKAAGIAVGRLVPGAAGAGGAGELVEILLIPH